MAVNIKRLYVSDIHMTAGDSVAPDNGKPYAWLDRAGVQRFATFLVSPTALANDQLVLVGDVVDTWNYPIDVVPPMPVDVVQATHNKPILDALKEWTRSNKPILYVPGNHDMEADASVAHALAPNSVFLPGGHEEMGISVQHGHANCLFNGKDPNGHPFPLGYYITRFCATSVNRGGRSLSLLPTIFKAPRDILALATGQVTLSSAVIDAVLAETGVTPHDSIQLRNGQTITVERVKELYGSLWEDWNRIHTNGLGPELDRIALEYDPFYDLAIGHLRIAIRGHSHNALATTNLDQFGYYLNLGAWVDSTSPTFATSSLETDEQGVTTQSARLFSWENGEAKTMSDLCSLEIR